MMFAAVAVLSLLDGAWSSCLPDAVPFEGRRYITSENGSAFPVGLAFPTWNSGLVIAEITRILIEERLGFHTNFSAPSSSSYTGLWAAAGCSDWLNYKDDPKCDPDPVFRHHIVLEVWGTGAPDRMKQGLADRPQILPEHLGSVGYEGIEGMHVLDRSLRAAWDNEGLALKNYESYDATWQQAWKYFDNYTVYDPARLKPCEDTDFMNTVKMAYYLEVTGDAEGLASTPEGHVARCWNSSWWFSPACRDAPETCIPSIDASYGYGIGSFMQQATFWNMPLAIAVGKLWGDWIDLGASHTGVPYWWQPDDTYVDLEPSIIRFPDHRAKEWANGKYTSALDGYYLSIWGYNRLGTTASRIREFLLRLDVPLATMNELLLEHKVSSGDSFAEVVCRWLKRVPEDWEPWIPVATECFAGQGMVDTAGLFRSNRSEATSCEWCPEGRQSIEYHDVAGSSHVCERCPAGTSQAKPGQTECTKCSFGASTMREESRECDRCPVGRHQDVLGSSACKPCPAPTTTLFQGASDLGHCVCPAGMYRRLVTSACAPCPDGMGCDRPNSTEAAISALDTMANELAQPFPEALPGYMTKIGKPLLPYKCKVAEWCPGGGPGMCARNRDPSKVGCADCVEGAYTGNDGECHACAGGEAPALMALGTVVSIAALVCLSFAVNRNVLLQSNSTTMCVIVLGLTFTGVQTMSAFSNLSVKWVEPLKSMLGLVSLLSFDLKILKVECLVGSAALLTYVGRQLVAPVGALLILVIVALKKRFVNSSLEYWVEAVNTVGSVFQIFFISILLSATGAFVCFPHPGSAGFSLWSSPSVLCDVDDEHTVMIVVGLGACAVVILPFLSGAAYATLSYHTFVSDASGSDGSLRMFRFLFFRYRPSTYYFGGITLLRGFLVCLVPVVFRSEAAVQVLMMSAILSSFGYVQLVLQPWRSRAANLIDGGLTSLMVLILVSVAMSTTFEGTEAVIGALGAVLFALFFLIAIFVVAFGAYQRFTLSPFYHNFVCHHKMDAAAQARFLQLLLVQRTRQRCFIDSDDLKNLDELFDIVRWRVGRLVAYLTSDTLRRPWCAGEITITSQTHRRLVCVRTPSFTPPSDRELEDIGAYLDLSDVKLASFGVTNALIADAFRWLLQVKETVRFRETLIGRVRFQALVDDVLKTLSRTTSMSRPGHDDALVISSDPDDDEASASTGILVAEIKEKVLEVVSAGILILGDQDDLSRQETTSAIRGARAVVVILTPGSLKSARQLDAIVDAAGFCDTMPVIPVNTPHFRFPSERYHAEYLMAHYPSSDADEIWLRVQKLFMRISVLFATNASLKIIETQAAAVLARIQHEKRSSAKLSPMPTQCLDLAPRPPVPCPKGTGSRVSPAADDLD